MTATDRDPGIVEAAAAICPAEHGKPACDACYQVALRAVQAHFTEPGLYAPPPDGDGIRLLDGDDKTAVLAYRAYLAGHLLGESMDGGT